MIEEEVEIRTEIIQVDIELLEVTGICTIGRDLAQGPEVKRCHYIRKPGHIVRGCDRKTKDVAKRKEQASQSRSWQIQQRKTGLIHGQGLSRQMLKVKLVGRHLLDDCWKLDGR